MPRYKPPTFSEQEIDECDRKLAQAIHEAFEPKASFNITNLENDQIIVGVEAILDGVVNLHILCGSAGILEFQLTRDGGGSFTTIAVTAGQVIEGNFKRFGPNTTVYPLIAFANG
jgi:hypothetical protein